MIRFLIYIIPPIILLLLGLNFIDADGRRMAVYSFDRDSRIISRLFPAQRLMGMTNGSQTIKQTPVYFTVRAPFPYDQARVTVQYTAPAQSVVILGIERQGAGWNYETARPDSNGTAEFDLTGARATDGLLSFLISTDKPQSQPTSIVLNSISVELTRSASLWQELWQKLTRV